MDEKFGNKQFFWNQTERGSHMPCFVKYQIMLAICFADAVVLQKKEKKDEKK